MITLFAFAKIIGIPLAMLFFGMILLPDETYFLVIGGLTALAGIAMLFFSPPSALVLIPTGALIVAFGFGVQRRNERRLLREAEQTARSVARVNKLYIPPDRDRR